MQTNTQTELSALRIQRARLAERQSLLQVKLGKLKHELNEVAQQIIEIENEISAARLRGGDIPSPLDGSPSKRTLPTMVAWAALHQAITFYDAEDGLPSDLAHRAIRIALPGTPDSTIRSYLHRFKKRGLLVQKNGRWRLGTAGNVTSKTAPETGK